MASEIHKRMLRQVLWMSDQVLPDSEHDQLRDYPPIHNEGKVLKSSASALDFACGLTCPKKMPDHIGPVGGSAESQGLIFATKASGAPFSLRWKALQPGRFTKKT